MKLGFWEIAVILIVALLVIGPDKLPYYTKKLGIALREFRKVSADVTKDVRESVIEPLEEMQKPIREAMEPVEELTKDIKSSISGVEKDLKNIGKTPKEDASKSTKVKEETQEAQEEKAEPASEGTPEKKAGSAPADKPEEKAGPEAKEAPQKEAPSAPSPEETGSEAEQNVPAAENTEETNPKTGNKKGKNKK